MAGLADGDAVFELVSTAQAAGVEVVGLDPQVAAAAFGVAAGEVVALFDLSEASLGVDAHVLDEPAGRFGQIDVYPAVLGNRGRGPGRVQADEELQAAEETARFCRVVGGGGGARSCRVAARGETARFCRVVPLVFLVGRQHLAYHPFGHVDGVW